MLARTINQNGQIISGHFGRTTIRYISGPSTTTKVEKNLERIDKPEDHPQPKKKTAAEMDEELRQKMESLAGDGGEAGVELEDGQPVAMKRSVKNNMFRYI